MRLLGGCLRMLLLVVALALSLFMPNILVGLAVWPVVWLAWDRIPDHERISTPSVIELLPFAIAGQVALDSLVPYFGEFVVLVVNLMIVATLRRQNVPHAVAHRVPDLRARRQRVQRVITSREAARAASACEGARRAS